MKPRGRPAPRPPAHRVAAHAGSTRLARSSRLDGAVGQGVITTELLRAGAHVVAIELHEQRVAYLRVRSVGRGAS